MRQIKADKSQYIMSRGRAGGLLLQYSFLRFTPFFLFISNKMRKKEVLVSKLNSEKFRAIRLWKGMTQQEFADLLGVSVATVARIESGSLGVSPRIKAKIASRVNLDDDFLDFYEKMKLVSRFYHT